MAAQGIYVRHGRRCRTRAEGRCNCRRVYEAWVYSARDRKKINRTFPTEAAAKAWRADALSAANRRQLRVPVQVTLRQAAEEWLAGAEAGTIPNRNGDRYKPSALRGYRRALELRVLPQLGHFQLAKLERGDVQDFADRLAAGGSSASTIQNTLDPLRVIYRRAIRRDQVAVDPTDGLELRRPRGRRDRIASPDEATALLVALPDEDRTLWATALYAGLRRGELRALRWVDIDLAGRELHVRRAWDDCEGAIDGKSDAAERTVPIIGRLAPELAAHKLASRRAGEALVFGMTATHPFDPSTVRRRARAAWKQAGLEPIGLHESRHTFASLMIASGVNAKALSTFMGHANIGITFDTYGHLMPGGRDEAREAIDGYLARTERNAAL